jgi:hypothetical protein
VSRLFALLYTLARAPRLREVVRWSLPALLVGLALRVVLTVQLPWAVFHDDTPDFLTTPDKLFNEGKWELHEKKTFLVPLAFTAGFALPVPAMKVIPLAHHVLGLALVLLTGALVRLWFAGWRLWIIPLTLVAAVNPFLLWYEHTLMAETIFLFCTVLLALAGTLYAEAPSPGRFVFLCVALFLEAGARPEGKLLFGFGLLLVVLVHRRELRTAWRWPAMLLGVALLTHLLTKTSQAGLLLYTSVARLTPAELRCAPGFDAYIAPIRADLAARWAQRPEFPRVRDRKAIAATVERYLKENPGLAKVNRNADVSDFCLRLAKETCLRSAAQLPGLVVAKFRAVCTESPAGLLDTRWLFEKQRNALVEPIASRKPGDPRQPAHVRLAPGLFGRPMATEAAAEEFVRANYREVGWFNDLSGHWLAAAMRWRLPDAAYPHPDHPRTLVPHYGVPIYFVLGAAGALAVMLRGGALRPFHVAWGLALFGFFFTIMLTANVRPRFRIVFEPFWLLYLALLADVAWSGAKTLVRR